MQFFSRKFGLKVTALLILLVVAGAGISLASIKKLSQVETEIQKQREEIIRISRERLEETRQARIDSGGNTGEVLDESFSADLSPAPKTEEKVILNNSLPDIIAQWRPRVAYLTCEWDQDEETFFSKSGSGVSFSGGGDKLLLFTNNHVIWDDGFATADRCLAKFPGIDEQFLAVSIVSPGADPDLGVVHLKVPANVVQQVEGRKVNISCSRKAEVGEAVIILGYPTIGTQGDITVTEGIISGLEGNYFITSAKVDEGNSGGAAILVKDNCYLGIPTYVKQGGFESLARILDRNAVADWFGILAQ